MTDIIDRAVSWGTLRHWYPSKFSRGVHPGAVEDRVAYSVHRRARHILGDRLALWLGLATPALLLFCAVMLLFAFFFDPKWGPKIQHDNCMVFHYQCSERWPPAPI